MITGEDVVNWQVLIVDDHLDSLEVAALTLEHNGAQVMTAENGEEGLTILETFRPTFILLDLSMPVLDGWGMLYRLRQDPELAHIPVIALTAHAMAGDRELVLDAGFDYYFSKPFSPFTFLDDLIEAFNTNEALAKRIMS